MSSRSATALKRRIVAGVLVLLSIVLITVYFREPAGGGLHSVQSGGATVLRPFEVGANRVAAPFRDTYNWFAGLIDGIVRRIEEELGEARQIATGGLAQVVVPFTETIDEVDDMLTLKGLRLIHERNTQTAQAD